MKMTRPTMPPPAPYPQAFSWIITISSLTGAARAREESRTVKIKNNMFFFFSLMIEEECVIVIVNVECIWKG